MYVKDLFAITWASIIGAWYEICKSAGVSGQARHFIYTPGRILEASVDHALEILGLDTDYEDIELSRDVAEKALVELLHCFYYLLLTEFEGAQHVKRKMNNQTEFAVNEKTYPRDLDRAIKRVLRIEDDTLNEILAKSCEIAAKAEVSEFCSHKSRAHWSLMRSFVHVLRPYALHWIEDHAIKMGRPGGIDHQAGLQFTANAFA